MKSPTSPASTIATAAALSSPDAAFAQPALGIEELAESCQVSSATISHFSIKFIQECFSMHIEKRVYIAVPPMVVEQIWSEVDRWHLWDPDTRQARLNGSFAVGARGRITPSKGMGVPMIITERTEGRSFTVEGYIPLFRMHFEHTVAPADGGSEVVHRVWFTGALAFLFGPGVARQLREGLPRTMQSLKSYAEQRHKPFNSGA